MTKMRTTMMTLAAAIAAFLAPPLAAQSSESGPALGVARVSLVNGDVTTRRGEAGDWIAAVEKVNLPQKNGHSDRSTESGLIILVQESPYIVFF